jgi:hypothetical protein
VLPWVLGGVFGLDVAWRSYHGLLAGWWWPFKFLGCMVVLSIFSTMATSLLIQSPWWLSIPMGVGLACFIARDIRGSEKPTRPQEWTPAALVEFGLDLETAKSNYTKRGYSESVAVDMNNCVVEKLVAAVPGGPKEAVRLGKERFYEIAKNTGLECTAYEQKRLMRSAKWFVDFRPAFIESCVVSFGEKKRTQCTCLAETAPKIFDSPAALMAATDKEPQQRSEDEVANMKRLDAGCEP